MTQEEETQQYMLVGSWSLSGCAFSYEDTGIGGFEGSFSINEEGLLKDTNILRFDRSGRFSSGFRMVDPDVFAGESLDLTQYDRWRLIEDSDPIGGSILSGELVFEPSVEGFGYTVSLSGDDKLTLVITELYVAESQTTREGYRTMGGEVPMTYTMTLVPTPQSTLAPSTQPTAAAPDEPGIFPIEFTAYDLPCSITGYEISRASSDEVAITLYGNNIGIQFKDGNWREWFSPLLCEIYSADGNLIGGTVSFSNVEGGVEFVFSNSNLESLEKFMLINGETDEVILSLDANGVFQYSAASDEKPEAPSSVPVEYIGQWIGYTDGSFLEFTIEADGSGVYTYTQGRYSEKYGFTLEIGTETFSVQIPSNNTSGIVAIDGTYEYLEGILILDITTTLNSGRPPSSTVPCVRVSDGVAGDGEYMSSRDYEIQTAVYDMIVIYMGQWKDGKPNGSGIAIVLAGIPGRFEPGDTLAGFWVDGLLQGPGVYTSYDGVYSLRGTFINGLKEGVVQAYQYGIYLNDINFVNGSPA